MGYHDIPATLDSIRDSIAEKGDVDCALVVSHQPDGANEGIVTVHGLGPRSDDIDFLIAIAETVVQQLIEYRDLEVETTPDTVN